MKWNIIIKVKKPCNLEAKTRYSIAFKVGTCSENKKILVLNKLYGESQDSFDQLSD